jgi:hypothetical protein
MGQLIRKRLATKKKKTAESWRAGLPDGFFSNQKSKFG